MSRMALTAVLSAAVLWPAIGYGQDDQAPPARHDAPRALMEEMGMAPEDLDEQDVRELVEVLRMARLSKAVGLDKEETVVLVRVYDRFKSRAGELNRERRRIMDDLKRAVRSSADDALIEQHLNELIEIDKRLFELRLKAFETISEDLTTEQRAKLYVFMREFDEELRRMVVRARRDMMRERAGNAPEGRRVEDRERRNGPPPSTGDTPRRPHGDHNGPPDRGDGPPP